MEDDCIGTYIAEFWVGDYKFKTIGLHESFRSALVAKGNQMTLLDLVEYWDQDNKDVIRDIFMRRTREQNGGEIQEEVMLNSENMEDGDSSLKRKVSEAEDAEDEPRKKNAKGEDANTDWETTDMDDDDDEAEIHSPLNDRRFEGAHGVGSILL